MGHFLKSPSGRTGAVSTMTPHSARRGSVVLHLGAAHTGTGAVRAWCRAQADRLADEGIATCTAAWSDPLPDGPPASARPRLDEWLEAARTSAPPTARFRSFYSGGGGTGPVLDPQVPGIYPHLASHLAPVGRATEGLDRHVQFAVADHGPFLEAVYMRQVEQGMALTFTEFLATVGTAPSWVPVVEALVATFGRDHVTVYDATASRPLGDRLLGDAMGWLGVTDVGPLPSRTTRRPSRFTRRMADLSLAVLPHLRSDRERVAFGRFLTSELAGTDRPASFLTPERSADLSARYADDLRRIRRMTEVR